MSETKSFIAVCQQHISSIAQHSLSKYFIILENILVVIFWSLLIIYLLKMYFALKQCLW